MKTLKIQFPKKPLTSKEIMGDNTLAGGTFLYNGTNGWYTNQAFFITEKTRKGSVVVDLEITHRNTTYTEAHTALEKQGDEMLNFAEYLYILKEYPEFREILKGSNYIRTSSFGSGGDRVRVGGFVAGGLGVLDWSGSRRGDALGVAAARKSLNSRTIEPLEDLSLRVKNLEDTLQKIGDILKDYA